MAKNHLARLNAPKCWPITRKGTKFVPKTAPGPYGLEGSVPLSIVVRDMLKDANTAKEARTIISSGKILVNKKPRKDDKFPVGLMDIVEIPDTKAQYRMMLNYKGKFVLHPIPKNETGVRLCKISSKTTAKKGKVQLNFHDGSNLLVDNNDYKPGDTLLLTTGKAEVKDHFKLDKGSTVYLTGGNKVSAVGKVKDVKQFRGGQPANILVSTKEGIIETRKKYAFAIGKDKPAISLPENE